MREPLKSTDNVMNTTQARTAPTKEDLKVGKILFRLGFLYSIQSSLTYDLMTTTECLVVCGGSLFVLNVNFIYFKLRNSRTIET